MKKNRTTISIPEEIKLKLERTAIDISYETGKTIKWTELVHYMIKNYKKLAKEDIKEESK